ncbi:hypothetical protein H1R20_g9139, partial [Candolleomyces eurysporus]
MSRVPAPLALFTGAHDQSFQDSAFATVGQDMYLTSFNFNLNAPDLSITPGQTTPPSPAIHLRQLRRRLRQFLSEFFHSAEHRDALHHGSQLQRAVRIVPTQQEREDSRNTNIDTTGDVIESSEQSQEGIKISSMNSSDVLTVHPSESITNPEIYIRVPGKGVTPGDVGILNPVNGFQKIFNIWDGEALRDLVPPGSRYQAPPREIRIHPELREGDTVVDGILSVVRKTPSGYISAFEFQCCKQPGAVLVCTSSADLEELVDPVALQDFIFQHAGLIYQRANSIQRVADQDSLYIVTGCIKSDSWAIAAYSDIAEGPLNALRLERDIVTGDFGAGTSSNHSPYGRNALQDCVQVDLFPAPIFHPCDEINDLLLEVTGADCALSHDDIWRSVRDAALRDGDFWVDLIKSRVLCIRNAEFPFPMHSTDFGDLSGNWRLHVKPDDAAFSDIRQDDLIIVIFGSTGAGKSSFINGYCGEERVEVNKSLASVIAPVTITLAPNHPSYPCRRLTLVDTPGLGTYKLDYRALIKIAVWLAYVFDKGTKVAGLVYLHNITQSSFGLSAGYEAFREICGEKVMERVVMATTHWGSLTSTGSEIREHVLRGFWKDVLSKGAAMMRIQDPRVDSHRIIDHILRIDAAPVAMQIQEELVDMEMQISNTKAGKLIQRSMQEYWELLDDAETQGSHQKRVAVVEEQSKQMDPKQDIDRMLENIRRRRQEAHYDGPAGGSRPRSNG